MKAKQAVSRYILKKYGAAVALKRYRTTAKDLAGAKVTPSVSGVRRNKQELLLIDDPKMTVALPLWEAKRIAWIALEGLARQSDAPPWELIVEEEANYSLGAKTLEEYIPRLVGAGCCRVLYVGLNKRIPLAAKWRNMALEAGATRGFMFQAADDYSPPSRIAESFALLQRREWVQQKRAHFFDIGTEAIALYDAALVDYPTAPNMATRTKYAKLLPICNLKSSVDAWLYQIVTRILGREPKIGWLKGGEGDGVLTNGVNKITSGRLTRMRAFEPPFREPEGLLDLPDEVWHKLRNFM